MCLCLVCVCVVYISCYLLLFLLIWLLNLPPPNRVAAHAERSDQTHLEALLGKAQYLISVKQDHDGALTLLNQAVALFPTFIPGLVAKAWAHMALNDWDGAVDTTRRCLDINADCVPALHIQSICILARTGQYEEVRAVWWWWKKREC